MPAERGASSTRWAGAAAAWCLASSPLLPNSRGSSWWTALWGADQTALIKQTFVSSSRFATLILSNSYRDTHMGPKWLLNDFFFSCRSNMYDAALPVLPENGLSNRIRGLFESTISTQTGSHCPLLWRMYIHFLVRWQEKQAQPLATLSVFVPLFLPVLTPPFIPCSENQHVKIFNFVFSILSEVILYLS